MTGADTLSRLRAAGVEVWLDGEALRYRAPPGALTPERLDWLKAHREALVEALRPARYGVTVDPAVDFYRRLFEGQAARALVSLEPADVRRAVDLGLVTAEVAQRSVVLAYRRAGVAGALIAIPRDRYDGAGVLQAFHETTAPADCAHAGNGSTVCA